MIAFETHKPFVFPEKTYFRDYRRAALESYKVKAVVNKYVTKIKLLWISESGLDSDSLVITESIKNILFK
jgi:hypothetical protein